nr:MAG TPA: hypothetical protein [Caudoviricetes sp.]
MIPHQRHKNLAEGVLAIVAQITIREFASATQIWYT